MFQNVWEFNNQTWKYVENKRINSIFLYQIFKLNEKGSLIDENTNPFESISIYENEIKAVNEIKKRRTGIDDLNNFGCFIIIRSYI
jgi:hypothetical protein